MPCDKIGKGKQGTSYVPGRTPTTAEPRFVKAQKSKAYSKGDCPASTHKSQRVPVGKPNSSRSSGPVSTPQVCPEIFRNDRDLMSKHKIVKPLKCTTRESKSRMCEPDFHLQGVSPQPGDSLWLSQFEYDMKSSTDSLPQDTDFHESVGPESLPWTDGGNPVPPGQPVWGRPLQGSLQITHVAGIPVASWPDLAEGVPSPPLSRGGRKALTGKVPRREERCGSPARTFAQTSSSMSDCSDSEASDWETLDWEAYKETQPSHRCRAEADMAGWVDLDAMQPEVDDWTLVN